MRRLIVVKRVTRELNVANSAVRWVHEHATTARHDAHPVHAARRITRRERQKPQIRAEKSSG